MLVVVTGVFGQHGGQVTLTEDEHPVGALPSCGAYPAFRERVRAGRLWWCLDHVDGCAGEHRVEDGGEYRVAVAEQEPQTRSALVEVDQHVSGLLRDPGTGRMGGHPEDVDLTGGDLYVESAWGAVSVLPPVRFPRPLAEPDVRLSSHPALHGRCRWSWFRRRSTGWGSCCRGSGT